MGDVGSRCLPFHIERPSDEHARTDPAAHAHAGAFKKPVARRIPALRFAGGPVHAAGPDWFGRWAEFVRLCWGRSDKLLGSVWTMSVRG